MVSIYRPLTALALAALLVACGGGAPAATGDQSGVVATWIRNYGGDGGDARGEADFTPEHVSPLPDGGQLVTGTIRWPGGDQDLWVARLDAGGTVLWSKSYGEIRDAYQVAVVDAETNDDGSVVLAGHLETGIPGVEKVGADGEVLWRLRLAPEDYRVLAWDIGLGEIVRGRELLAIARVPGGGYVVGGREIVPLVSQGRQVKPWMARVAEDGELVWLRTFAEPFGLDDHKSPKQFLDVAALDTGEFIGVGRGKQDELDQTRGYAALVNSGGTRIREEYNILDVYDAVAPLPGGAAAIVGTDISGLLESANDVLIAYYGPGLDDFAQTVLHLSDYFDFDSSTDLRGTAVAATDDGKILVGGSHGTLARYDYVASSPTEPLQLERVTMFRESNGVGEEIRSIIPRRTDGGGPAIVTTSSGVYEVIFDPAIVSVRDVYGAADQDLSGGHPVDMDGDGDRDDGVLLRRGTNARLLASDGGPLWDTVTTAAAKETGLRATSTPAGYVVAGVAGQRAGEPTELFLLGVDEAGGLGWQRRFHIANGGAVGITDLVPHASGVVAAGHAGLATWCSYIDAAGPGAAEWGIALPDFSPDHPMALVPADGGAITAVGAGRGSGTLLLTRLVSGGSPDPAWDTAPVRAVSIGPAIRSVRGSSDGVVVTSENRVVSLVDLEGEPRWSVGVDVSGAAPVHIDSVPSPAPGGGAILGMTLVLDGVGAAPSQDDLLFVRIGSSGDYCWHRIYGTSQADKPTAVGPATGGGYIAAAHNQAFRVRADDQTLAQDAWLLRLDARGEVVEGCVADRTDALPVAVSVNPRTIVALPSRPWLAEASPLIEIPSSLPLRNSFPLVVGRSCSGFGPASDPCDAPPPPDPTAKVVPAALDFACDDTPGWTPATVVSSVTLQGAWGDAPTLRLVGPGAAVRVVIDGVAYADTAPLVAETTSFTVQINRDLGDVPATLTLELLDSAGTKRTEATLDLNSAECATCSPGDVGPMVFEWRPTPNQRKIGISDGGAPVAWTILDEWSTRTGITQFESPTISPDGNYLAFTAGASASAKVYVLDLKASPQPDPVRITPAAGYGYRDLEWSHAPVTLPGEAEASYALACARRDTPGVFALKITLLAVPSDPNDLVAGVSGAGTVISTGSIDRVTPTWSPDDTRIAYQDLSNRSLYSVAVDGTGEQLEYDAADLPSSALPGVNFPRWHPTDTDRIAFHHGGAVYVLRRSAKQVSAYSPVSSLRYGAAWTRDGSGLVYAFGLTDIMLLCDADAAIESKLFSLPAAEVYSLRIPHTQAATNVLNTALAK